MLLADRCGKLNMRNLTLRIQQHIEALDVLQIEIEQLQEGIEMKTAEAARRLRIYQVFKRQADRTLESASENYEQALSLFPEGDVLFQKLRKLKVEHIALSKDVMGEAETEPAGRLAEQIFNLKRARGHLKKLYGEIQKLRAETLPTEPVNTLSTVGQKSGL
jgi:FtsZ-binding cell division protein ZapB